MTFCPEEDFQECFSSLLHEKHFGCLLPRTMVVLTAPRHQLLYTAEAW